MTLSIVIPVRDDATALARLLPELQALRAQGVEVIVVEARPGGAAQSAETEKLRETRELADIWLESEPGRALQLQAGLDRASNNTVWFLHADSSRVADCAAWLMQAAQAGCEWGRFDVALDDSRWLLKMVAWFMNWRSRLTAVSTGDQGIWAHRELLTVAGGWPQQDLMEDVELCLRLRQQRAPLLAPRGKAVLTTSARRWQRDGVWRTILLMWKLRLGYALGADPGSLHQQYYQR